MKLILQDQRRYIIRFDKGEEVLDGIGKFIKEQAITACVFQAIGACENPELGFYNPHIKDYRKKPFLDELEILSLNGNGAIINGEPILHAHGIFGKNDFTTIGGHVFKVPVSVTCEVFLIKLDGEIKREQNTEFNLSLLI
jgi:predicted DNA-binding protein with PD1-like motif